MFEKRTRDLVCISSQVLWWRAVAFPYCELVSDHDVVVFRRCENVLQSLDPSAESRPGAAHIKIAHPRSGCSSQVLSVRSYDRTPIAPMGKRASAVARQEKRLSPSRRQTFRFSFLPPHDPIRILTGAGYALPLRSAGCGGTSFVNEGRGFAH